MTHEEIYKLYRKTDYDKPKLLKVLADACSITIAELNQIIKDGDEKSMPKGARWTDEQHDIYNRMTAENAKPANIAEAMGLPVKAVRAKRSNDKAKLNSIHEPKGKPATVNKDFDELFDSNDPYYDCAPDIDTGEDISEINAKIADLCETPDPKPKPDYTESLIETLRESIETLKADFAEIDDKNMDLEFELRDLKSDPPKPKPKPSPVPRQWTIFSEAHAMLWGIEADAKRMGMTTTHINLDANIDKIHVRAWDDNENESYLGKKNPLAGTAIPTSGEA